MFGASVKTGKTLVTIVAAAADPTGLAVAGAVLDTAIHAYDELAKKHPDLGKLAKAAQKQFDDALKTPFYDKPDNARILLPQMLEESWRHADFAGAGLNASKMIDAMLAALPAGPDIREVHRTAFRNLFGPILQTLCDDKRLIDLIQSKLWQEQFRRQEADSAKLDTHTQLLEALLQRMGGGNNTLANANTLGIDDQRALAAHFGEPDLTDKDQIVKFLTLKAEEYRTFRALIDGLDERVAAIGNLKGAAQDAAERLDFDAVEELLARSTKVEAEIFAKSCETRARNALLRGQVDQAALILTAGADALAVIDPLEPARRKAFEFREILYNHGLRYVGRGLACAVAMAEDALRSLTRENDPQDWAKAQGNLANALTALANRSNGEQATPLLTRAIASFDEALSVLFRADHPVEWAMTQQNLANALHTLAFRSDGEKATSLLTRAIATYKIALTVFTRADHPVNWATTQQNLAGALQTLAFRSDGVQATDLLITAIVAFEEALTVRTRADHPVPWATTQQNLANALKTLAARSDGKQATALLTRAIACYEGALTVFTQTDHPDNWATTQHNFANTLATLADHIDIEQVAALLSRAVATYEKALTVLSRADHPVYWATTQENLARAYADWSKHPICTDPRAHLEKALAHVEAALTVFDPVHLPYQHNTSTSGRNMILSRLAAL